MKFSLTFWISDPDGMDNVKSDVMLAPVGRLSSARASGFPIRSAKSGSGAGRCRSNPWWRFRAEIKPLDAIQDPNLGLH